VPFLRERFADRRVFWNDADRFEMARDEYIVNAIWSEHEQDEIVLPRRWRRFFITISGLIGFILLEIALRAAA